MIANAECSRNSAHLLSPKDSEPAMSQAKPEADDKDISSDYPPKPFDSNAQPVTKEEANHCETENPEIRRVLPSEVWDQLDLKTREKVIKHLSELAFKLFIARPDPINCGEEPNNVYPNSADKEDK